MSNITNENLDKYLQKIKYLKTEFLNKYKKEATGDIIKKMRIIHGEAILTETVNRSHVLNKDTITDIDKFNLSADYCILELMNKKIMYCEKLQYEREHPGQFNSVSQSGPEMNHSKLREPIQTGFNQPIPNQTGSKGTNTNTNTNSPKINHVIKTNKTNAVAKIRKDPTDGADIISVHNIKTDDVTDSRINSELPQDMNNRITRFNTNANTDADIDYQNTTEFLNKLSNSEASRLMTDDKKNLTNAPYSQHTLDTQHNPNTQSGGNDFDVNRPTVVNYWADWCGFSRQFMPNWNNLRDSVKKKYGEKINVIDLNVKKDNDLMNMAKQVGVEGYPTVVMFKDNKIYRRGAGTSKDVEEFVDEVMKK